MPNKSSLSLFDKLWLFYCAYCKPPPLSTEISRWPSNNQEWLSYFGLHFCSFGIKYNVDIYFKISLIFWALNLKHDHSYAWNWNRHFSYHHTNKSGFRSDTIYTYRLSYLKFPSTAAYLMSLINESKKLI